MVFTWIKEGRASFEEIKEVITLTPIFINPNIYKDFIIYSLVGKWCILGVLTQLNDVDEDNSITFFSEGLKNYAEKYSYVEK